MLFQNIDWDNKNTWGMDRLCFGAYLLHLVFIHTAYKYLKAHCYNSYIPVAQAYYWG